MSFILTIFRYVMAIALALTALLWTLARHVHTINEASPHLMPNNDFWRLVPDLLQTPYGFVFLASPLLLGLGSGLLCLSMERESIHHMFRPLNVLRVRMGGLCLSLAFTAALVEPLIYGALFHTDLRNLALANDPSLFLLGLLGGWLSTLSVEGRTLFAHAEKLRGKLDEIV